VYVRAHLLPYTVRHLCVCVCVSTQNIHIVVTLSIQDTQSSTQDYTHYTHTHTIQTHTHRHTHTHTIHTQQLINLKMARAYRTTSSEALCILTGMTPITLKLEEVVKQYTFRDKQQQQDINLNHDVEHRHWPHPANAISITEIESHEDATISAYTDGSKYQRGVGSGIVIFKGSEIIDRR